MRAWLKDNQYLIRAYIYIGLVTPAVIWWKDSILFVILISLGANIDTSLGAHEARKSRKEQKE